MADQCAWKNRLASDGQTSVLGHINLGGQQYRGMYQFNFGKGGMHYSFAQYIHDV